MARHIESPTRIQAQGEPPTIFEEFVGRVNSGTTGVSIDRMVSPAGWSEPGQTPEFEEYTVVLRGTLRVETRCSAAGQAIISSAGQLVRYSSPHEGGAEYVDVCVPAYSPETVRRDC